MSKSSNAQGLAIFAFALVLLACSRLLPDILGSASVLIGCLLLADVRLQGAYALAAVVLTFVVAMSGITYVLIFWPAARNGGWVVWILAAIIALAAILISTRHWRAFRSNTSEDISLEQRGDE